MLVAQSSGQGRRPRTRLPFPRPDRATTLTALLALLLLSTAAALVPGLPQDPLVTTPGRATAVVVAVALGCVFVVAELGQALIEVRRQAYSFSLSGVPLLLGLLFCPPQELLAARIAATAVAFALQRAAPLKFGYNLSAYVLDTALTLALVHQVVGAGAELSLAVVGGCYLCLAAVDLLMSALVLLVIRINQGPVSRGEVVEVLAPAAGFVALNTAVGSICAVLISAGPLGWALLAAFVACTAAAYRGYLVLRGRHQSLELVQGFIERGEGAASVDELMTRLLVDIRTLLRAERAELVCSPGGSDGVRVGVDADGRVAVRRGEGPGTDPVTDRAVTARENVHLDVRTADRAARRWLEDRDVTEALVVPLSRSQVRGAVVVMDRLGDTTHFTRDDLALLHALAGHLAVAVQSHLLVDRLRHEATHDALTGLPNRVLLTDRLNAALAAGDGSGAAVLLLDLDRFKEVNDALGHSVGDRLLQAVAGRFRDVLPDSATVARLGGDEFAVLLTGCRDAEVDAAAAAGALRAALGEPVHLPDVTVSTSASIGVAVVATGCDPGDLLRHADTAMYAAKAAGTGHVVYTPDLDRGRAERLTLVADLHLALERGELDVHYQPKLDLASDAVTGVEALVRWTHPTRGRIGPDTFVPLAESTGLVDQLTDFVLGRALSQCRAWRDAGLDVSVAVNLSARNVADPALPEQVAAALVAAGLPPGALVLEITESSVLGDLDQAVSTLDRLAAIGVALSLDDFGTGYSSLSYLQRLPVAEVKVDRSFVRGLTEVRDGRASEVLVRSIVSLAASLGLRVVAEGVEDADVLARLRGLGCDLVQGYHVARPMPAAEFAAWMTAADRPPGAAQLAGA